MPDVKWTGAVKNMVLTADDQIKHPSAIKDGVVLFAAPEGRSMIVRSEIASDMVLGTYGRHWVSFPEQTYGDVGVCVGVDRDVHDPNRPIVIMMGQDRVRLLPGTAVEMIRDAVYGGRFAGDLSRNCTYYDMNLERRSITFYVMGSRTPGAEDIKFVSFVRGLPRLPWDLNGVEMWRRRMGLAIIKGKHVRENYGIIVDVFGRDPLADPELGSVEAAPMPWSDLLWRRDVDGRIYIWHRCHVLECSRDADMARLEAQSGKGVMIGLEEFRHGDIAEIMSRRIKAVSPAPAPESEEAAEPEPEDAEAPVRKRTKK